MAGEIFIPWRCFRSYHQFCRVEKNRCRVWARGRPPGPQAALGGGLPLALTLACRCRVWARGRSPGPQPAVAATLKYFDLLHLHGMAVAPAPDLTVGQVTTLYDLYLTWFMQTDQFPRGKSGYGQVHNSMISSIPAIFTFRRFPGAAVHHFIRLLITKMAGKLGRGSGIYGRTHGGDPVPGSSLEILKQLPKAFSAGT